jgi:hypothetical protein
MLPSHSLWPDLHRNHLAAVIASPVSSCHRRTPPSAPSPFDSTAPIASSPLIAATRPEHCPTLSPEPPRRRAPLPCSLGRRANLTSGHSLPFPRPQKVRLELLMLADHSFSTPRRFPHRNLAGNLPALLPRRAKGLFDRISKVLRV